VKRPLHDLTQPGWAIAVAIGILFVIGLASISASRTVHVGGAEVDSTAFAVKQAVVGMAAIGASLVILRVGYMPIARNAYLIFAVCLLLLLPLLLAKVFHTTFGGLVPASRGAHRWIRFPILPLQPSELMKIGYILVLAWYLRYRKNFRSFSGLLWPFAISAVPMVMILMQPDLGTVLLFIPVLFGMLFVAGARIRHLALIIVIGLAVAPLTWERLKPYQRSRIVSVALQSEALRERMLENIEDYESFTGFGRRQVMEWKSSSGMQLVCSKAAMGSGGVFGQGWGQGTYVEYNFLPDRHNDFVFAIVGHQWGLVGCLVVLACYVVIVLAGVEIASVTTEPLGRLVAMGVVCLLSTQVIINVGMTMGLMPITGMTLPFVSYGGSSLLSNFLAAALLVSVSQHRPFILAKRPFEWSDPFADARAK
jgi:cell division protein FtsW (lipid II flippase)